MSWNPSAYTGPPRNSGNPSGRIAEFGDNDPEWLRKANEETHKIIIERVMQAKEPNHNDPDWLRKANEDTLNRIVGKQKQKMNPSGSAVGFGENELEWLRKANEGAQNLIVERLMQAKEQEEAEREREKRTQADEETMDRIVEKQKQRMNPSGVIAECGDNDPEWLRRANEETYRFIVDGLMREREKQEQEMMQKQAEEKKRRKEKRTGTSIK